MARGDPHLHRGKLAVECKVDFWMVVALAAAALARADTECEFEWSVVVAGRVFDRCVCEWGRD